MRNIITKRSRREKTIAVLCLLAFFLTGCDGWNDREGCDGYPYVADDVLADTVTLQVNGPPFRFDLEEAPVFKHTAGKILSYRAAASDQDRQIANPFIGGTKATLEIFPVGGGSARIEVVAEDECEKWDTLGVFVQVNDSSASPSASVRPLTLPTTASSSPASMP